MLFGVELDILQKKINTGFIYLVMFYRFYLGFRVKHFSEIFQTAFLDPYNRRNILFSPTPSTCKDILAFLSV